ncbi:MAG: hypothetical protein HC771_09205 [Synechococcales cyanobacterium CRU_2_2]|nr:hypothetical protein [Synechococcales cyanobacterium CRU_2_2]
MLNMRRRLMKSWLGFWSQFWAGFLLVLFTLLLWSLITPASHAHWADLASAEIRTEGTQAQLVLTYPTQLTAFADSDENGQLSAAEISGQAVALADFWAIAPPPGLASAQPSGQCSASRSFSS